MVDNMVKIVVGVVLVFSSLLNAQVSQREGDSGGEGHLIDKSVPSIQRNGTRLPSKQTGEVRRFWENRFRGLGHAPLNSVKANKTPSCHDIEKARQELLKLAADSNGVVEWAYIVGPLSSDQGDQCVVRLEDGTLVHEDLPRMNCFDRPTLCFPGTEIEFLRTDELGGEATITRSQRVDITRVSNGDCQ